MGLSLVHGYLCTKSLTDVGVLGGKQVLHLVICINRGSTGNCYILPNLLSFQHVLYACLD